MLDLLSLRLFVRAADLGSLSRAADQSNIALAAVSRRIALLEADFGVKLLARNGRGVSPTPAGQALLERARDIFRLVGAAEAELSDFAKGMRGSVTIRASTSAITQFLPSDLAAFTGAHPEIRLTIKEAYSEEIAADVRNGDVDVGVVLPGPHVAGLRAWPYRRDELAIVARRAFRPGIVRARFEEIAGEDLVLMEDTTALTRLLLRIAADMGIALRLRVKVDSFDAVCRMIQAGFGIGVLPKMAAMNILEPMSLRLIDLDERWARREMLVITAQRPGNAAMQLVNFLASAAAAATERTGLPAGLPDDHAIHAPD